MFNKVSKFFLSIAGWKSFLLAFSVYLVFGVYVMPEGAARIEDINGKEVEIIDLQFTYSPAKAKAIIGEYNEAAREYAARFEMIGDTFYPIAYTFLFIIILAWIFRLLFKYGVRYPYIHMMPLAIMLVDYCENFCIIRMFSEYPDFSDTLVQVSSFFTSLKWSLLGVLTVVILIALFSLVNHRFIKKQ